VRTVFERATGLGDAVRRAGELSARTVIFDVEPLVAYWNSTQKDLDEGIARVLSEIAKLPTVEVVCFSTNSRRRPSVVPSAAGVRVVYLASAGKPLRTAAYQRFPRPGVVIGDQVATDGILARRLGYAFIRVDQPPAVPPGARLMAAAGRLVQPLLFTNPPAQPNDSGSSSDFVRPPMISSVSESSPLIRLCRRSRWLRSSMIPTPSGGFTSTG
jgi:predicted HAD superfamily phosphohydrolase YqeG